ncbi:winged helix-turn-helix transcriptional regulator [Enterococcus faecalis]|uniref:winged helix-turn-helix transcriptional regulator n=1 Tax=Enterococcus faecalis TaxID=1351 RepID=UPI0023B2A530|nr:helix-turn-helix domain-containing protein [Enterococcus faecalis]
MEQLFMKDCGISKILTVLGGKWKFLIVWRIHQNDGIQFNQLQRDTNGITNVMLNRCLKELISDGFVRRKDYQTVPPHVEYFLTDQGKSFIDVMDHMNQWGRENL